MRECGKILYSRRDHICMLNAEYLRLQTHTQNIIHCFSTVTTVARRLLNVTLYVHFLPCYLKYILKLVPSLP
jgi:Tat protein secretion system quality control protein TatD with DNase activity